MENFLQLFDSIKYYNVNDDKRLSKKIKNDLEKYKSYLNQNYKKDFISFFSFRILLNKQNIFLDDETVEYLIYRMKKDCKNNNNNSMFDLCYKTLIDIINNEENENVIQINQVNNNDFIDNINDDKSDLLQVSNEKIDDGIN